MSSGFFILTDLTNPGEQAQDTDVCVRTCACACVRACVRVCVCVCVCVAIPIQFLENVLFHYGMLYRLCHCS